MKFFVIGSNSFSGSHFVSEVLEAGYNVCGISRSKQPNAVFLPYTWGKGKKDVGIADSSFSYHKINLNRDLSKLVELLDAEKPDFIVNFAAQGMVAESWQNPTDWYQTNVVAQVALHDALRKRSFIKKYIHVTTPEVYGSTNGAWIGEDSQFKPSTPYAASRAACDMHLDTFFTGHDFPVVKTRAANVYGPGQQLYRIIPRTMLAALTGKTLDLHGGGMSTRSFIHIKDVAKATLLLALEAEPGTTWHLSTNESCSIRELVKKVCNLTGADFEQTVIETGDRLGKDQSYLLDSSAIRERHGWKDEISLTDGLRETLGWVESNLETLALLPWSYQHKS